MCQSNACVPVDYGLTVASRSCQKETHLSQKDMIHAPAFLRRSLEGRRKNALDSS